jgi:hypothetical protein
MSCRNTGGTYPGAGRLRCAFTGEIRIIPTEKSFAEYFRGRRNVELNSGVIATFTFR